MLSTLPQDLQGRYNASIFTTTSNQAETQSKIQHDNDDDNVDGSLLKNCILLRKNNIKYAEIDNNWNKDRK